MLTKSQLVKMLYRAFKGEPKYITMRLDAAKNKNLYWNHDDWMYVKDLEVSLKKLHRELSKKNIDDLFDVENIIFKDDFTSPGFCLDVCIFELLASSKNALENIENPD